YIELLVSVLDGLLCTHRVFSSLGSFYNCLIYAFEWLAFAVLFSCVIFLIRRNALHIYRFSGRELKNWPKTDANLILIAEILLMTAFLFMNAADFKLQQLGNPAYHPAGAFPVSQFLLPLLPESAPALMMTERFCWWFHIIGVLAFLNYLPISKHLHIIVAIPNTYFSKLEPKGKFNNMPAVTEEVKALLDPSLPPPTGEVSRFGVKDVQDLTWKN